MGLRGWGGGWVVTHAPYRPGRLGGGPVQCESRDAARRPGHRRGVVASLRRPLAGKSVGQIDLPPGEVARRALLIQRASNPRKEIGGRAAEKGVL